MTAPDRMPSRRSLEPPLPHDVAALVAAGRLVQVEPGLYRRAPRPDTAPTVRELHDHCAARIARALLAGDVDTARLFHHAARLLLASVGAGDDPDLDEHEREHLLPPTRHQNLPPTRPAQTTHDADPANTPAPVPSPADDHTGTRKRPLPRNPTHRNHTVTAGVHVCPRRFHRNGACPFPLFRLAVVLPPGQRIGVRWCPHEAISVLVVSVLLLLPVCQVPAATFWDGCCERRV